MSHFHLRKDNDCLNCGAIVQGRYCHVCGQENIEPKETFWHLVTHFTYDVTHFDGKFFSTVKYLLLKPGFLSIEYIEGRRMFYLHPIRMYVFISAFFFLFFFSLTKPNFDLSKEKEITKQTAVALRNGIQKRITDLKTELADTTNNREDSLKMENEIQLLSADLVKLKTDTINTANLYFLNKSNITFGSVSYNSKSQYDSIQSALPSAKRDGWFTKKINYKGFEINSKYKNDKNSFLEKFIESFFHSFPKIFFISLPLFALLLKLVYFRHKNYFYADHVIYSIHLYCATFLQLFLAIILNKLEQVKHLEWVKYAGYAFFVYVCWYFYKSLRNFYRQGKMKTILKALILYFCAFIIMMLVFSVFAVITLFNV